MIVAMLERFGTVNRFKLSLDFFSKEEKEACRRLFDKLLKECEANDGTMDVPDETVVDQKHVSSNSDTQSAAVKLLFTKHEILFLKEKYAV